MAAGRIIIPGWMPALTQNGIPIPNVRAFFFLNGTTTLSTVYADEGLTTPLTNPVAANSSGQFPSIWADSSAVFSVSMDAPYGPPGQPFTFDGIIPSEPSDTALANKADTDGGNVDADPFLGAIGTFATLSAATAQAYGVSNRPSAVRLDGYTTAGDGGAALYKPAASEPSHAGKFQTLGGQWWEIAEPEVTPEMFGGSVQTAFNVGAAIGATVRLTKAQYVLPNLTIPDGSVALMSGSVLRRTGATTSGFVIGNNVTIDTLSVQLDGTETTALGSAIMTVGDNFTCDKLIMKSDTQVGYPSLGGVRTTGRNTKIGALEFENLDYCLDLLNASATTLATGSEIGMIWAKSYMRAFFGRFASFKLAGIYATGRSPNAALVPAPGRYQSNLYEGCQDCEIGDVYMEDCGHGMRIGGSPNANAITRNISFGNMFLTRARGCGFKVNPTRLASPGVTEKATNISCLGVFSVDGGDDVIESNRELLRLTHAVNVRIGYAHAVTETLATSHHSGLIINDCAGVEIGSIYGDNFNSGFVVISATSDITEGTMFGGPVSNLRIRSLSGSSGGANAIGVEAFPFVTGKTDINCEGIAGYTTRILGFFGGSTVNAPFNVTGQVNGGLQVTIPTDPLIRLDVTAANKKSVGQANWLRFLAASEQAGGQLDLGITPAADQFGTFFAMGGNGSTASQPDVYGGSFIASRPSGPGFRRGAGVACKQDGAAVANTGLAVLTTGTGSAASDQLTEHSLFGSNGDHRFNTISRGPVIRSPDGTRYRIVVANGGALSTVAV